MRWLLRSLRVLAARVGWGPKGHVLVTGAPRSGTSAVSRWLGAQPGVVEFFESRVLVAAHATLQQVARFESLSAERRAHAATVRRTALRMYGTQRLLPLRVLIDKEPLEPIAFPCHDYAAFVRGYFELFPDARIVFMVRDPVAVVWSMTRRQWGHSLVEGEVVERSMDECVEIWRATARVALDLSDDPRVLLCHFAKLVSDPGRLGRTVALHTGLRVRVPFEPRPFDEPAFSAAERESILGRTEPERARLGL